MTPEERAALVIPNTTILMPEDAAWLRDAVAQAIRDAVDAERNRIEDLVLKRGLTINSPQVLAILVHAIRLAPTVGAN